MWLVFILVLTPQEGETLNKLTEGVILDSHAEGGDYCEQMKMCVALHKMQRTSVKRVIIFLAHDQRQEDALIQILPHFATCNPPTSEIEITVEYCRTFIEVISE